MGLYAIVKGEIVDGIAIADGPLETDGEWICVDDVVPQPGPTWTYKDGVFSPPVPPPEPVLPNVITKVAFRFRLTDAEYAAILNAAKTDAEVQVWVETFNMVSQIDLDDPRTQGGVAVLVAKALLTQERATEILTTPVQPDERP
jgi:hypothetical protein